MEDYQKSEQDCRCTLLYFTNMLFTLKWHVVSQYSHKCDFIYAHIFPAPKTETLFSKSCDVLT
jgi:hypothetical protein